MKNKNINIIAGIVSGIAIGATLGILFAPDKGSETRKKIKKSAKMSKEALIDKIQALTEPLNHLFSRKESNFADELDGIVKDVSYKAEEVIEGLEQKLTKLKKKNEKMQMN